MSNLFLIVSTILFSHEVLSQNIRQPDNLLNRNLIESLIEAARQESPRYITQSVDPFTLSNPNAPVNIPDFPINIPSPSITAPNPYTTIPNPLINLSAAPSDLSVCKNLANTIQLMVLSDLLKTRERDEIAIRLDGPVLSDLLSTSVRRAPVRSNLGSNLINTFSPTVIPSNVVPSSIVGSSPRIVISPGSSNVLSGVSNGRIERGALTNMLKLLGGAL